jgi:hypothetical protein
LVWANIGNFDEEIAGGQRFGSPFGPFDKRDAIDRRHEVGKADRCQIAAVVKAEKIEMVETRHRRGEASLIFVDQRERRTGDHVIDAQLGGDAFGQSRLAGAKIAMQEDDVALAKPIGQDSADGRGFVRVFRCQFDLGVAHEAIGRRADRFSRQ